MTFSPISQEVLYHFFVSRSKYAYLYHIFSFSWIFFYDLQWVQFNMCHISLSHCVSLSLIALIILLFSLSTGIISGAVLQLRDEFCLSCSFQEMVISAMLMGAIAGSLIGGHKKALICNKWNHCFPLLSTVDS